jgi:glutaminase
MCTRGGSAFRRGIVSVAKPFTFALVCEVLGPAEVREKVGVNATGRPFNSPAGIEESPDGRTNPMVNSGAIATTSLVPGRTAEEKWRFVHDGLSRFAGRRLSLEDEVYMSASETNQRNRDLGSPREARPHPLGSRRGRRPLHERERAR